MDRAQSAWHEFPPDDVFERVGSCAAGLSSAQAADALARYGPNELTASRRVSAWALLLSQFRNVLILLLLVATAASALLGHGTEAIAITVIVLFAVLLGFVQEFRAERALEALGEMAAPQARVLRDGDDRIVPARDLVRGDVILLQAGDRVPADARLFEAVNLRAEEAALTGESVGSEKSTEPVPGGAGVPVGDRTCIVHAGTNISYGRGRAVVVETGMGTEFGRIARMLETVATAKTPLQKNLDRVGAILARAALLIVAVIVAVGVLRGQPPIEMLIFGIALAVAAVPEALPAVVTISLALGVRRMVRRNALVRRLPAVETLGSTTVICSDKTGTLTRDEMTVRRLRVAGVDVDVSGAGYAPEGEFSVAGSQALPREALDELLLGAALCCDATIARDDEGRWRAKGDPTEAALVVAAAKAGLDKAEIECRFPRVGEIPFSSDTKRMTTMHRDAEGVRCCSKGAPEVLLQACSHERSADGLAPLDERRRDEILQAARNMATGALRVLAIAAKRGADGADAESGMTLLGLVGMMDPPRPEARDAIATCGRAGIHVVMITGDHPVTAKAVAADLGIPAADRVVTGVELDAMGDEELAGIVERTGVFARVSPAHKLRLVTALQARGHVAAMTGDGVNDAPALKKADVGIAMGIAGTDVSKEAAAVTLLDDNFASIVAAVEEGRAIFANIKKYLSYLLSSNIGEIGLIAGASALGWPLPLTAVQILYVNLATDGLPALALSVDPHDRQLMERPPRERSSGVFTRPVVALVMAGGAWSTLTNLAVFGWALGSGRGIDEAITMTFVSLVLIQFLKAYSFRSEDRPVLESPFANRWLNLAVLWEAVLLVVIVYTPLLQEPFETFPLTAMDWAIVFVAAATIVPFLEVVKAIVRRVEGSASAAG